MRRINTANMQKNSVLGIYLLLTAKAVNFSPRGRLLGAWLALTVGYEISKPIGFHGIYRWLALTMLRATRARLVVSWLSEGVINQTFPGSSPASPDIGVWLLKKICSFPMIPIKLSVSKMNDYASLGAN